METSIETEPVPQDVSLERRGSTVVAVPREGLPVLTAAEVEETTARLRPAAPSASGTQGAQSVAGIIPSRKATRDYRRRQSP